MSNDRIDAVTSFVSIAELAQTWPGRTIEIKAPPGVRVVLKGYNERLLLATVYREHEQQLEPAVEEALPYKPRRLLDEHPVDESV